MNKIDFGSDEEFIANYQKLKSSRKMAELYQCTKTTILNHAKKIGFNPSDASKQPKLSEQDKEQIKSLYNEKTSTELAKEYNVSRGMITKIWYDANLKGKERPPVEVEDLTGKRFGKLVVLKKTNERTACGCVKWLCKCDCGNFKTVGSSDLRTGKTLSCGCLSKEKLKLGQGNNFKDLTGQRFGKLVVLNRCEDKITNDGNKNVQYLCQCDCGNITKVLASNLRNGNTQSCGFCGSNSHGNIKIAELLKQNNIPFTQEKRFDTCKDKTYLPFDFFVDNTYCIEYDGKQHFETNTLFDYETTHSHDLIKNKWCKEHHIPLIRIPYTHYDQLKIEDLLLSSSKFIV